MSKRTEVTEVTEVPEVPEVPEVQDQYEKMRLRINSLIPGIIASGPPPVLKGGEMVLQPPQLIAAELSKLPVARQLIILSTGGGKTLAQLLTGQMLMSQGIFVYFVAPPNARQEFFKELMSIVEIFEQDFDMPRIPMNGLREHLKVIGRAWEYKKKSLKKITGKMLAREKQLFYTSQLFSRKVEFLTTEQFVKRLNQDTPIGLKLRDIKKPEKAAKIAVIIDEYHMLGDLKSIGVPTSVISQKHLDNALNILYNSNLRGLFAYTGTLTVNGVEGGIRLMMVLRGKEMVSKIEAVVRAVVRAKETATKTKSMLNLDLTPQVINNSFLMGIRDEEYSAMLAKQLSLGCALLKVDDKIKDKRTVKNTEELTYVIKDAPSVQELFTNGVYFLDVSMEYSRRASGNVEENEKTVLNNYNAFTKKRIYTDPVISNAFHNNDSQYLSFLLLRVGYDRFPFTERDFNSWIDDVKLLSKPDQWTILLYLFLNTQSFDEGGKPSRRNPRYNPFEKGDPGEVEREINKLITDTRKLLVREPMRRGDKYRVPTPSSLTRKAAEYERENSDELSGVFASRSLFMNRELILKMPTAKEIDLYNSRNGDFPKVFETFAPPQPTNENIRNKLTEVLPVNAMKWPAQYESFKKAFDIFPAYQTLQGGNNAPKLQCVDEKKDKKNKNKRPCRVMNVDEMQSSSIIDMRVETLQEILLRGKKALARAVAAAPKGAIEFEGIPVCDKNGDRYKLNSRQLVDGRSWFSAMLLNNLKFALIYRAPKLLTFLSFVANSPKTNVSNSGLYVPIISHRGVNIYKTLKLIIAICLQIDVWDEDSMTVPTAPAKGKTVISSLQPGCGFVYQLHDSRTNPRFRPVLDAFSTLATATTKNVVVFSQSHIQSTDANKMDLWVDLDPKPLGFRKQGIGRVFRRNVLKGFPNEELTFLTIRYKGDEKCQTSSENDSKTRKCDLLDCNAIEQKIFDVLSIAEMQLQEIIRTCSWGCDVMRLLHQKGVLAIPDPPQQCYRDVQGAVHPMSENSLKELGDRIENNTVLKNIKRNAEVKDVKPESNDRRNLTASSNHHGLVYLHSTAPVTWLAPDHDQKYERKQAASAELDVYSNPPENVGPPEKTDNDVVQELLGILKAKEIAAKDTKGNGGGKSEPSTKLALSTKPMKAMKAMKAIKPMKTMKAIEPMKAMKAMKPMKTMKAMKAIEPMKARTLARNKPPEALLDREKERETEDGAEGTGDEESTSLVAYPTGDEESTSLVESQKTKRDLKALYKKCAAPLLLEPEELKRLMTKGTYKELRSLYRKIALVIHPDKGGSNEQFKEATSCLEEIKKFSFSDKPTGTHISSIKNK